MAINAYDPDNRDPDLLPVENELEGDAATLGYIKMRLEKLERLMTPAEAMGAAGMELTRIIGTVEGMRLRNVGELMRIRTPDS